MTNTNRQEKDGLFFKVSIDNIKNGIIADLGLREFAVLAAIASFADDKGEAFPSQETIAELCGVSKRTIIRLLDNICDYRTAEGKPVLVRMTKRKDVKKTINEYQIQPSSGMAFGSNKVVTDLSPRKGATVGDCEKSSEGSDKFGNKVVTKSVKGSDRFVTLTKAINESHKNKNQLEQEPQKAASFETEKHSSSNDNNQGHIVGTDKESKEAKDNQSVIVEDTKRKEKDSERSAVLAVIEANRKAREKANQRQKEERRRKAREELAAIATASESLSEGKRSSVQQKPHTGQIMAFESDGDSFEDLVRSLHG